MRFYILTQVATATHPVTEPRYFANYTRTNRPYVTDKLDKAMKFQSEFAANDMLTDDMKHEGWVARCVDLSFTRERRANACRRNARHH